MLFEGHIETKTKYKIAFIISGLDTCTSVLVQVYILRENRSELLGHRESIST